MNMVKDVAGLLGLRENEEFRIKGSKVLYRFGKHALEVWRPAPSCGRWLPADGETIIGGLVTGALEVDRKRWVPCLHDKYYFLTHEDMVESRYYTGDVMDALLTHAGNCYRTREEALSTRAIWKTFFDSTIRWEVNRA